MSLDAFDAERYTGENVTVTGQPVVGNIVELAYQSNAGGSHATSEDTEVRGELLYWDHLFGDEYRYVFVIHDPERRRAVSVDVTEDGADGYTGWKVQSLKANRTKRGRKIGRATSLTFMDEAGEGMAPALNAVLDARPGDTIVVNGTEYGVFETTEYGPSDRPQAGRVMVTRPDGSEYTLKVRTQAGDVRFKVRWGDELETNPEVRSGRFRERYFNHENEGLDTENTEDAFPAPHYAREGERVSFTLTGEDYPDERVSGDVSEVRYFPQRDRPNILSEPEVMDPETRVELDDGREVRLQNTNKFGSWVTRNRREQTDGGEVRAHVIIRHEDADMEFHHVRAEDIQREGGEDGDDPEDDGPEVMTDGGREPLTVSADEWADMDPLRFQEHLPNEDSERVEREPTRLYSLSEGEVVVLDIGKHTGPRSRRRTPAFNKTAYRVERRTSSGLGPTRYPKAFNPSDGRAARLKGKRGDTGPLDAMEIWAETRRSGEAYAYRVLETPELETDGGQPSLRERVREVVGPKVTLRDHPEGVLVPDVNQMWKGPGIHAIQDRFQWRFKEDKRCNGDANRRHIVVTGEPTVPEVLVEADHGHYDLTLWDPSGGFADVGVYVGHNDSARARRQEWGVDRGELTLEIELDDDDLDRFDLPTVTGHIQASEPKPDEWDDVTLTMWTPEAEDGVVVRDDYTTLGYVVAAERAEDEDGEDPQVVTDGGEDLEALMDDVAGAFRDSDVPLWRLNITVTEPDENVTIQPNGPTGRPEWLDLRPDILAVLDTNGFRYRSRDAWAFVEVTGRQARTDGGMDTGGPPAPPRDPHSEAKNRAITLDEVQMVGTRGANGQYLAVWRDEDATEDELEQYHLLMDLAGYVDLDPSVLNGQAEGVDADGVTMDVWAPKGEVDGDE